MDKKKGIEGARAIGAFVVLMWHLYYFIDPYFAGSFSLKMIFRGEWANVFFFALSGYLVSYTRHGCELPSGYSFVKKRLKKIYPLWLATLLFFCVLSFAELYIRGQVNERAIGTLLLKAFVDVLLVQSWIPGYPYLFDLNGPGWFLSAMLLAWVLTIPTLRILRKMKAKHKSVAFVLVLVFQVIWTWGCSENTILSHYATGVWWMYPLTSYLAGMIVGERTRDRAHSNLEAGNWSLLVLSGGLLLCYYVTFNIVVLEFAVVVCYMIYIIRLLINEKHPLCTALANRCFTMIGSLSFEIYLLHIPVARFFEFLGFIHNQMLMFCVIILTTILCAFVWKKTTQCIFRGTK